MNFLILFDLPHRSLSGRKSTTLFRTGKLFKEKIFSSVLRPGRAVQLLEMNSPEHRYCSVCGVQIYGPFPKKQTVSESFFEFFSGPCTTHWKRET